MRTYEETMAILNKAENESKDILDWLFFKDLDKITEEVLKEGK